MPLRVRWLNPANVGKTPVVVRVVARAAMILHTVLHLATPCYGYVMAAKTITHRELRNESGRILREVQQGQTFIVTNNGEAVAALQPIETNPLAGIRHDPPKRGMRFADIFPEEVDSDESALEALMYLRGER